MTKVFFKKREIQFIHRLVTFSWPKNCWKIGIRWQIGWKVRNRENVGFQVKCKKSGTWEYELILKSNIELQKIEEHFVICFLERRNVKFFHIFLPFWQSSSCWALKTEKYFDLTTLARRVPESKGISRKIWLNDLWPEKFSLPSERSAPLRPWLNRLTWSKDSALSNFGSTGWICPALCEIYKLANLCNGLFGLDQFLTIFFNPLGFFWPYNALGYLLSWALIAFGDLFTNSFKDEFDHFCTWPLFAHGNWLHFAIYSLGHFKDKLSHSCTWLIYAWPLILFGLLFTWPLFALDLHFHLADHWTWP